MRVFKCADALAILAYFQDLRFANGAYDCRPANDFLVTCSSYNVWLIIALPTTMDYCAICLQAA